MKNVDESKFTEASLLTEKEASLYLNLSRSFLRQARIDNYRNDGPPCVFLGRAVRYRKQELDTWIAENTRRRRGLPTLQQKDRLQDTLTGIDGVVFGRQRALLSMIIDCKHTPDEEDLELLDGLRNLLDCVADYYTDVLGKECNYGLKQGESR